MKDSKMRNSTSLSPAPSPMLLFTCSMKHLSTHDVKGGRYNLSTLTFDLLRGVAWEQMTFFRQVCRTQQETRYT